ncbi:MAG: sugar ABC transporter permease [Anaerolineae bacterium]
MGPSVVMMVTLMVIPLAAAFWLGMHLITFQNISNPTFVGLENYTFMLSDPGFWSAMRFTIVYTVITVPIQIGLGFVIAVLLDQITTFRAVYIAAILLPFIVTPIVGTLIYRQTFDRYGIYPWLLDEFFNIDINFFRPSNIQFLIFSHAIWYVTPFAIVTLFAGLQTIPQEPLEAATVDGANWFQRLFYVVVPRLRSLFVFIALISIMDAYRVFDSIFVLTKQNPIYNQFETLMYYNYQVAVNFQRLGRANAMSVLTVIGVLIILIPFLYITYKQQAEVS